MPDEPEAHSLLALMLLHDARREARFRDGELVLLEDQDRGLWDGERIAAGRAALGARKRPARPPAPTSCRPQIAVLHVEDVRDWPRIAALYGELARQTGSPVVELNRAVAMAETAGPEAGLKAIEGLELDSYPYLHATRADFLRRLGRADEARAAYERALELAHSVPDCRFLSRRLTELSWTEARRVRFLH